MDTPGSMDLHQGAPRPLQHAFRQADRLAALGMAGQNSDS